jgi:hypothetical protein
MAAASSRFAQRGNSAMPAARQRNALQRFISGVALPLTPALRLRAIRYNITVSYQRLYNRCAAWRQHIASSSERWRRCARRVSRQHQAYARGSGAVSAAAWHRWRRGSGVKRIKTSAQWHGVRAARKRRKNITSSAGSARRTSLRAQ